MKRLGLHIRVLIAAINRRGTATYAELRADLADLSIKYPHVYLWRAINRGLVAVDSVNGKNTYTLTPKGTDVIRIDPPPEQTKSHRIPSVLSVWELARN